MQVNVNFDEKVLIDTVITQVVQAIKDELHNLFPRLRRDEVEDITNQLYRTGTIPPPAQETVTLTKTSDEKVSCMSASREGDKLEDGFYHLTIDGKPGDPSAFFFLTPYTKVSK